MEGFLHYWFGGLFLEFYGNDLLRPLNILIKYQKQKAKSFVRFSSFVETQNYSICCQALHKLSLSKI